MNVVAAEREEKEFVRPGPGGGGRDDGGRGPRGNGGGRNRPFGDMEKSFEKIRLVTWFILLVVLMTFIGLLAAYVVISSNRALEWRPFELPAQVWISTVVLLSSSATYVLSHRARMSGAFGKAKRWLIATAALGGVFVASQSMTWIVLYRAGYYLQSNPYAGFFYFITILHALHVVGGMCALGFAVLRTWDPSQSAEETRRRLSVSRAVGDYWHFMDLVWVVIIVILGFWK